MGTYVTAVGFVRPTLQELVARFEAVFRGTFGETLDTDPTGPTGQLIALLAKAFADAWDSDQEVYASHDPANASGSALDVVCSLTNVNRIAAAAARVEVACYVAPADLGLVLGSGKQVKRTRGGLVFSLLAPLTVQTSACRDLYLVLPDAPTVGTEVSLVTTFGTFAVAVPAVGDPITGTYALLAAAIEASAWAGSALTWTAGNAPAGAMFAEPCLRLLLPSANFGATVSAPWEAALCGSAGMFEAIEVGPQATAVGEVTEIVTSEAGWASARNLTEAIVGRFAEYDEELRLRRAKSFRAGYATELAIQQALLNRVAGITAASVTSNRTMVVDGDGRPAKSFEVIVLGGLDQEVGQVVWDTMPAGIEAYADTTPGAGGVAVTVTDSQGTAQVVKFGRPVTRYLHLRIMYALYSEESFPANGDALLREAILEWAAVEYTLGQDIIPQRALAPVYTVPGIGQATPQVALTAGEDEPPTWSSAPIAVGGRVYAQLLAKNLSLEVVSA